MITVHHLRVGRSVFIVWLLEELGLDYELKIYLRDANGRAQDDLKQAHPLGKSPVIEDEGMVLSESTAITTYLIDRYGADSGLAPDPTDAVARAKWNQWLHYPEASVFAPMLIHLLLGRTPDPKPALIEGFAKQEAALHLRHIQNTLGDHDFIMGDRFQGPDIGISFVLQMARNLGLLGHYPKLEAYLARTTGRPAFARAVEKSGG